MVYDYTSPESVAVPSTTNVDMDRAICSRLTINFEEKALLLDIGVGVINGAGIDKKSESRFQVQGDDFDTLLAVVTNDGETLGDAIERILMEQANTDGVLPAGSVV